MTLSTFAKYVATEGLSDDSPLVVYDSEFGDANSPMKELLDNYTVPSCFSDDLFALAVDEKDNTTTINVKSTLNPPSYSEDTSTATSDDEDDLESNHSPMNQSTESQRPPWRWILMGPA